MAKKEKGSRPKRYQGDNVWDNNNKTYRPMTQAEKQRREELRIAKLAALEGKRTCSKKKEDKATQSISNAPSPKEALSFDIEKLTAEITNKVKQSLSTDNNFSADITNKVREMSGVSLKSTEIPEDDLLDKPVFLYAYRAGFVDLGYTRKGKTYMPPYGKAINFKMMPCEVTRDALGKRHEHQRCMTEIWSKKVLEYVRGHNLYGIEWFESIDGLKYADRETNNYRLQAFMEIDQLNERQIVQECINRGIPVSNDTNELKRKLVEHKVENNTKFQKNKVEEIAVRNLNQQLLNEKRGVAAPV